MKLKDAQSEACSDKTHSTFPAADKFAEYKLPLRNYFLRRVNSAEEAEDLVQEVFLRLLKRNVSDQIDSLDSYLFRVAANTYKDYLRYHAIRGKGQHCSLEEAPEPRSELSAERVLIAKQSLNQLTKELDKLPERTRDIFVMRAIQNRPYAEIAELMDLSTRAVEKHTAKALGILGEAISY